MKLFFLGHSAVSLSLLSALLLLPFAQVKRLFFGLPLYFHEVAIIIAFCFFLLSLIKEHQEERFFFSDKLFLLGAGLFFSGATLSFIVNPFSFTGLGMLKSWFFFPLLAFWLIFSETRIAAKRTTFFFVWFLTLFATALGSLFFLFANILTYDHRLSGSYPSPNFLAFFLAPAPLIALYLSVLSKGHEGKSSAQKIFLFLGSVLVLVTLFFTRSYEAWGALLVAVICFFLSARLFQWHSRKALIIILAILLSLGTFLFFEYGSEKWQTTFSLDARSSLSSRLMIWYAAEKIVEDNLFFGIGLGRFQNTYLEYQEYFPPYLEWAVPEPHNLFLALLLGTGLIGFFGFLVFVGRFTFLVLWSLFSETRKEERLTSALALSLLLLTLVYGITDTPYFKNDLAFSFILFLALGFPRIQNQKKNSSR